ncbi:hypothetical protein SerAS12_1028 [Serratia sp. AS12]|uniref:DUF4393 domain-containing protein n=1 Tax=Serratia TaxID=613 RepID=UPI00020E921B|nr:MULTISPECIES: DUF4393 domain-containing protein [Serratia]AEF44179.1 hypothetical protein SerAS9_1028 [Serratia plymuthica AS9]AEF49131.1 hypothetical protein SerAS12_1028 [Serratia sp. AS12]AEG26839.1 hypothetical protein SerAS13_1028 [Serratia sp. AS13]UTN97711.1 DUF4393 domain-containing protein [Serratia plymuthica]
MSEEESTNSKVADVANAVAAVAKEVPIYQDALQPAAQEIGKALGTVAKLVNVVLAPVSAFVWGYDQIREFTATKVAQKLKNITPEDIVSPQPNIAVPAIEALRYTGYDDRLADLYASLLATSMDRNTAKIAHPAFVEIIKQLTSDEAKIVSIFDKQHEFPLVTIRKGNENGSRYIDYYRNYSHVGVKAECERLDAIPEYLDNLCRLGICYIPEGKHFAEQSFYDELLNSNDVLNIKNEIEYTGAFFSFEKGGIYVTDFGHQFIRACLRK